MGPVRSESYMILARYHTLHDVELISEKHRNGKSKQAQKGHFNQIFTQKFL